MEYRINRDILKDKNSYEMLYDMLDKELAKRKIPTKGNRIFKTSTVLLTIFPFPYKGNSKYIKLLEDIPGFISSRKFREVIKEGENSSVTITMATAHFNGLKLLNKSIEKDDIILFYESEEDENLPKEEVDFSL
jgi:hypothetical protein